MKMSDKSLFLTLFSHGEVYAVLWSLYMALAAERDAVTVAGD